MTIVRLIKKWHQRVPVSANTNIMKLGFTFKVTAKNNKPVQDNFKENKSAINKYARERLSTSNINKYKLSATLAATSASRAIQPPRRVVIRNSVSQNYWWVRRIKRGSPVKCDGLDIEWKAWKIEPDGFKYMFGVETEDTKKDLYLTVTPENRFILTENGRCPSTVHGTSKKDPRLFLYTTGQSHRSLQFKHMATGEYVSVNNKGKLILVKEPEPQEAIWEIIDIDDILTLLRNTISILSRK